MSQDENMKGETPDKEMLCAFYRTIYLIRKFGEVGRDKYREGFIHGYFHSYIGQEAVATGACYALESNDYIVSNHRGHGHCIAKGADIGRMMAELYGREDGYSHGRGGSMHMADHSSGNIGTSGIVGAGIPIAAGVALGVKQEGSKRVVVSFFGDGAANNGVFAETLNLASIYSLPIVFVLENNCYAATTPASQTAVCEHFADRASGYGLPAQTVFGNDPLIVYNAVSEAVSRARNGQGPTLIEAETYRRYGHHINDAGSYMPEDERIHWLEHDPLEISMRQLIEAGVTETEIMDINRSMDEKVVEAEAYARESKEPDIAAFLQSIATYDV